jgi:hypothetical protein
LRGNRAADAIDLKPKRVDREIGAKTRDRFEFVQRSAGVAQRAAATSGTAASDTLSPTPPLECLSITKRSNAIVSPERIMASVSAKVSAPSRPRIADAMSSAATGASSTVPAT